MAKNIAFMIQAKKIPFFLLNTESKSIDVCVLIDFHISIFNNCIYIIISERTISD